MQTEISYLILKASKMGSNSQRILPMVIAFCSTYLIRLAVSMATQPAILLEAANKVIVSMNYFCYTMKPPYDAGKGTLI